MNTTALWGWGSQIRSYALHPYTMVEDDSTNVEARRVLTLTGRPICRQRESDKMGLVW